MRQDGTLWSFNQEVTDDITLYAWWRPVGSVNYTIRHVMQDGQVLAEQTASGLVGDAYVAYALGANEAGYPPDAYLVPDAPSKTVTLQQDEAKNVVTFTYTIAGLRNYTVSYYKDGTTESLHPDKTVTGTNLSMVVEKAVEIEGYTPLYLYLTQALTAGEANHLIFYYKAAATDPGPGPAPDEPELTTPSPARVVLQAEKLLDGAAPQEIKNRTRTRQGRPASAGRPCFAARQGIARAPAGHTAAKTRKDARP